MNESFVRDICRVLGPRVRDYNGLASQRNPQELNEIRTAQGRSAVYLKTEVRTPKDVERLRLQERHTQINKLWESLIKGGCHV